jgi:uncharacterized OsmC-like protein
MATIETIYKGQFRTEPKHLQSGQTITTDAPTDNHGLGEFFSPTDLVAAALGSCMGTLMEMAAMPRGIDISGMRIEITKVMYQSPRRIGEIHLDFYMPAGKYEAKDRTILERAAETCPVAKSLHPDLKIETRFHYPAE